MMATIDGTMDNSATVNPKGAGVARSEFGAQQLTTSSETSATAAAAQAEALVKARFAMAMHRPRDWMQVRRRLLDACLRQGFCNTARYRKPIGGGKFAEGWSIRFAEEVVRCVTNLHVPSMVIFDDSTKRIVQQTVTDLESNVTYSVDVTIEKTVERSKVSDGQEVLGMRKNSYGKTSYKVAANEGDLLTKEAALMSKALRNAALRLLPGDIQDDCLAQYNSTMSGDLKQDRGTALKGLADAFNGIGVQPKQLGEYLGHSIEDISFDEIVELRQVYAAVRDNETTWREALTARMAIDSNGEVIDPKAAAAQTRGRGVMDHVAKQAAKMKQEAAAEAEAAPAEAAAEHPEVAKAPEPAKRARKQEAAAQEDAPAEPNPWDNPKYKKDMGYGLEDAPASPDVSPLENPGESQE